ncbi:MAG: SIS domain-containing protein [Pseudomonadota bacterium]
MAYVEKTKKYVDDLIGILQNLDFEALNQCLEVVERARDEGKNIYIFGNGGSAATASHAVCDFNKGLSYGKSRRFRVICLNDNMYTLSAYSNDVSYSDVFVEQLKNFLAPGDIVIGISGSGNSENVIRAIDYANEHKATTIGFCGFDGGRLKEKAQVVFHVNVNDMQKVEDIHAMFGHIAVQILKQ